MADYLGVATSDMLPDAPGADADAAMAAAVAAQNTANTAQAKATSAFDLAQGGNLQPQANATLQPSNTWTAQVRCFVVITNQTNPGGATVVQLWRGDGSQPITATAGSTINLVMLGTDQLYNATNSDTYQLAVFAF